MPDEDATLSAPVDEPLLTTEIDPATTADGPLAYSAHTTSMPVIDYRPPRLRPVWIVALVILAAVDAVVAAFMLGRTTAPAPVAAPPPAQASAPAQPAAPPVAAPPPAPVTPPPVAVPPPVTVVLPPPTTTSIPPLATPQARIAEPIICSLHNQYPEMEPVDLALSLVDRSIYSTYADARVVVDLVLADGCHGI